VSSRYSVPFLLFDAAIVASFSASNRE
jgi:hypothetical protein